MNGTQEQNEVTTLLVLNKIKYYSEQPTLQEPKSWELSYYQIPS